MDENEMVQDKEISLYDLVQPLLEHRKLIVVTAFLGVLAGAAGWWMKGYDAELKVRPVAKLDFVEWRRIVTGLPALAESRLTKAQTSGSDEALYRKLGSSEWWSRNVIPQYRYSKTDLKEFGTLSKDEQERGAMQIELVAFRGKASERTDAVAAVIGAERFFREGGLLLALKSFVERLDLDTRRVPAEVQAKIARDEIQLSHLRKRVVLLNHLAKQYPEKLITSVQTVLDPKDASARYLPLGTQQIAVEGEINAIEESISRARDRLAEARVVRAFIEKALPLIKSGPEGFGLAKKLEAIEAEVRTGIDRASKAQVAAINDIARELNDSHERFKSLFESDNFVSVKRPALGQPVALGLVGGGLAGILLVFVRVAWQRARRERKAAYSA